MRADEVLDTSILGAAVAALIAAAGALVGYGVLRQKVATLESWRIQRVADDRSRDREIQGLLEVAATTTANVKAMTESMNRLIEMHMHEKRR